MADDNATINIQNDYPEFINSNQDFLGSTAKLDLDNRDKIESELNEDLKPFDFTMGDRDRSKGKDLENVDEEEVKQYEKKMQSNKTNETVSNDEEEEKKFVTKMIEKKNKLEKEKRTNVLKKVINIRKVNREMGDQIINNADTKIKQDKLIAEILAEINFVKMLRHYIKEDIQVTENILAKVNYNHGEVTLYCNTLRRKFKTVVDTVSTLFYY